MVKSNFNNPQSCIQKEKRENEKVSQRKRRRCNMMYIEHRIGTCTNLLNRWKNVNKTQEKPPKRKGKLKRICMKSTGKSHDAVNK